MRLTACVAVASIYSAMVTQHVHAADAALPPLSAQGSLQPAFAPWDNIEELVSEAIGGAKKQVLVQAYLLTSRKIVNTLVAAHRRGVNVAVLVDAEQLAKATPSMASELAAAGIPVWLETKYQSAHNKIILIDATTPDAIVITGSYNFTWTAQRKNAENVLIARKNPELAARYVLNWERHRQDAMPYKE